MRMIRYLTISMLSLSLFSCSALKSKQQPAYGGGTKTQQQNSAVQSKDQNARASQQAISLTQGWPEASQVAAKDIISKYGMPSETTSNSLIWRNNIAPFKRITVYRHVYTHMFPLLHQDAVEHVVDYEAPTNKVDDVWNFNGSVVLERTRGEMMARGANEAMNVLSMNLAHDVMHGKKSAESARIQYGKEYLNWLNGNMTALTTVVSFGEQLNTADSGETIVKKIRWVGDRAKEEPQTTGRRPEIIQAEEARGMEGSGSGESSDSQGSAQQQ